MADIFQEVEEEVRKERYEQLWKKYGNYVIAVAALIVMAVAGLQAWRNYELSQRQQISDRFLQASQAFQAGNAVQAQTDFAAIAQDAPAGYATLAKFNLAGTYLAQNRREEALALLRELMASSDPLISAAARLRIGWVMADASPRQEIADLLQPLMTEGNPWRFAASEVLAYADLKNGAQAEAQAAYQRLAQEPQAPASLRQRAAGLAEFLKANPDGAAAAAQAAAPPSAPSPSPAATAQTGTPAPAQGSQPR